MPCARYRIFLATLIVAAKYLNDSSPKNQHWVKYGVIFNEEQVNIMEKQLLFCLDYDLRFNEFEACMIFAPLLNTLTPAQQHEARVAAVARVRKAGKARAEAQMPPTPPADPIVPPTQPSTIASTVRGIVKRLSSTHLSVSSGSQSRTSSPMYSTISNSSSTSGSEMGSLIDDSGSSSSGMSGSEDEADESGPEQGKGLKKFILKPAPAYACRQGRKPSDTSSVRSTATVKGRGPFSHSRATAKRFSSYYVNGHAEDVGSLPVSTTMPSITRVNNGTAGFLSRMWGAAKGQQLEREGQNKASLAPPIVNIVEPAEVHPHGHGGSSAFRRMVHSRSTMFRNGSQILDV
jgi:PHO85 cyclin-1